MAIANLPVEVMAPDTPAANNMKEKSEKTGK
jgi:hypothetical protein